MRREFGRHAIYFAPRPASPLGRFGPAWLGWDAERGVACAGPEPEGLPRPRADLTAMPRRYGFHGTLKAPFRLVEGATAAALDADVAALARAFAAFELDMRISALGPFLALTPATAIPELVAVAAACVMRLDRFRAPPAPQELAKRRAAGLTAEEEANLTRWGYPYVLGAFRFHLTLTGPLERRDREATAAALSRALAPALARPMAFADLCLFGEEADGAFRLVARHPLAAAAPR